MDTSGWFALVSRRDHDHGAAKAFFEANRSPLLTTDYVLDETVALLQARLNHAAAVRFLNAVETSSLLRLNFLSPEIIKAAIKLFRERPDKNWSLTDCTSFVSMKQLRIQSAFGFDDHFRQASFQLLPE